MTKRQVRLNMRGLPLDQQTSILREEYLELRKTSGSVRARVDQTPARLSRRA